MELTNDEMNLICFYSQDTKEDLVENLEILLSCLEEDELELYNLTSGVLDYLNLIDDDEFLAIEKGIIETFEELVN